MQELELAAANGGDPLAAALATYNLAMCYESGLGVDADAEKMLDMLQVAALGGVPQAAALFVRLSSAFQQSVLPSPEMGDVAYHAEVALQGVFGEKYFSTRIRQYEKSLQRAVLRSPFDIYSGDSTIEQQVGFGQLERVRATVKSHVADFSELRVVHTCPEYQGFGSSLLHYAARLGHMPLLKMFLEEGLDVNICTTDGRTPLASACMGGQTHIVEFLLQNGAAPSRMGPQNISPLHWLIMFEEEEQSKVFTVLRDHGAGMNEAIRGDRPYLPEHTITLFGVPLFTAIATRNYNLCKIFLDAGAKYEGFRKEAVTPLNVAVFCHIPELTRLLLRYLRGRKQKLSPLFDLGLLPSTWLQLLHGGAARQALEETLEIVLAAGYDINAEDGDGWTPLAHAIHLYIGSISSNDLLEVLVNKGAVLTFNQQDPIVKLIGGIPRQKQKDLTRFLLEKDVIKTTLHGDSLLHTAALLGYPEIMEAVLDIGVDVDQPLLQEDTVFKPLYCAVMLKGNGAAVRLLVERGADINATSTIASESYTALALASMLPIADGEVIDILIEHGVELEMVHGHTRMTIVHIAAQQSSRVDGRHILFHLLRHERVSQLCNCLTEDGFTPLQFAAFEGNLEAIDALIDAGGDLDVDNAFSALRIVQEMGRRPVDKVDEDEIYLHRLKAEKILGILLDKQDLGHGLTPLHIAASLGNYRRVVELVEAGADVWAGNATGKTAVWSVQDALATIPDREDNPNPDHRKATVSVIESLKKIGDYLQNSMVKAVNNLLSEELRTGLDYWDYPERALVERMTLVDIKTRDLGQGHPETLKDIARLARTYAHQDMWEEAEKWQEIVIARRKEQSSEDHPELLDAQTEILGTWIQLGKLDEAERLAHHLADVVFRTTGPDDSATLRRVLDISIVERALGHVDFAAVTQRGICTDDGPQDFRILTRIQLAITNCMLERWSENETLCGEILSKLKDVPLRRNDNSDLFLSLKDLGSREDVRSALQVSRGLLLANTPEFNAKHRWKDPELVSSLMDLASAYEVQQRWPDAEPIRSLVYEELRQVYGDKSHYTQRALSALITNLRKQQKWQDTVDLQLLFLKLTEERFVDRRHPQTLIATCWLAVTYGYQGRWLESEIILAQVVEDMKLILGKHHPETLAAMENFSISLGSQGLWDRAEAAVGELVQSWREAAGDAEYGTINALSLLVTVKQGMGKLEEAERFAIEVVEGFKVVLGEDHERTIEYTLRLASIYKKQARFERSEEIYLEVLEKQISRLGDEHPDTLTTMWNLADLYYKLGRHDEAEKLEGDIYNIRKQVLGENHHDTLIAVLNLAQSYNERGSFEESEKLLLPIVQSLEQSNGEKDEKVLQVMAQLGESVLGQDKFEEAERTFNKVLECSRATLGDEHQVSREAMACLAQAYKGQGRWRKAIKISNELLPLEKDTVGESSPLIIVTLKLLSDCSYEISDWQGVERFERQVWEYRKTTFGDDHPDSIASLEILLNACMKLKSWDKVQPLRVKMLDFKESTLGKDHPDTISALKGLATTHVHLEDWKGVEEVSNRLWELWRKQDEEAEEALNAKSMIALAYWNQSRLGEAEELQLQVVESYRGTLGETHLATIEAQAALARTYRKQKRLSEAEKLDRQVLEERKKQLGDSDTLTIEAMSNLAETLIAREHWHESENLVSNVLKAWESEYGTVSSQFITALGLREQVFLGLGRQEELEVVQGQVSREFVSSVRDLLT